MGDGYEQLDSHENCTVERSDYSLKSKFRLQHEKSHDYISNFGNKTPKGQLICNSYNDIISEVFDSKKFTADFLR